MSERVNKLYTPAELKAAIAALENSMTFCSTDKATQIVQLLHSAGYHIVYVGKI